MVIMIRWAWIFAGIVLLTACGRGPGAGDSPSAAGASSVEKVKAVVLVPPSNPQDVSSWEAFIHRVVRSRIKDSNIHPYSYLVPGGSDRSDAQRREGEIAAIRAAVENASVPGNMIVVAGPDSAKTSQVLVSAFGHVPEDSLQGLRVMYIGAATAAGPARKAVKASGAKFELMATGVPRS